MPTVQKTLRMHAFIKRYIASNGEAPTIREIGAQFDMSSSQSVASHLTKMVGLGLIKRVPNVSRGIRLIEQQPEVT
jgi:SOS-response transcriptional repressor LexA